ncbi:MAG TPA: hypothetical protein ENJ35_10655 [Gammaproteobacteria bacterium]|nr:hypothetical protein [Gammaproteobacteria bacterium]
MSATFYLFDVDHGQCAALLTPNGQWCIFDVGCTNTFSPVSWIAAKHGSLPLTQILGVTPSFRFLKGTISHLHGDHIADYQNMLRYGPSTLFSVEPDQEYLEDCYATCSEESSKRLVYGFAQHYAGLKVANGVPDYGVVSITELSLPVRVARALGGDANTRVNNASIVTRVDVYGNSILLCGDMERSAWEAIINDTGDYGRIWRPFLSNIDILLAPHHGHKSGYSTALLNLAKPRVVLASVVAKDPHVDTRYSQSPVRGIRINGTGYSLITTRKQGHIKVTISPDGSRSWAFGSKALV